MTIFVD